MKRQTFVRYLAGGILIVTFAVACAAPAASTAISPSALPQLTAAVIATVPKPTAWPPTVAPTAPVGAATPLPATVTLPPTAVPAEFALMISGKPNPLDIPIGVAVDAAGDIYVVDTGNSRVQKFDRDGNFLLMWGAHGSGDGQFDFTMPDEGRVALDSSENVYVVDVDNYRIQKFDRDGKFLAKRSPPPVAKAFIDTWNIAFDGQSNLYVADHSNYRIVKLDPNGKFLAAWGRQGDGEGQFNGLEDITVDMAGNVYVSDASNNCVQVFRQP